VTAASLAVIQALSHSYYNNITKSQGVASVSVIFLTFFPASLIRGVKQLHEFWLFDV